MYSVCMLGANNEYNVISTLYKNKILVGDVRTSRIFTIFQYLLTYFKL